MRFPRARVFRRETACQTGMFFAVCWLSDQLHRSLAKEGIMKKIILFLAFLLPLHLSAQVLDPTIHVYFHPQIISPDDNLCDGKFGDPLHISDRTFLIWVDMAPQADYSHLTVYILIADQDIRLWKGNWRPFLNGKPLFETSKGRYAVMSPIEIDSIYRNQPPGHMTRVHIHPQPLHADDVLTDGPSEKAMLLEDDTLLIWIDLLPEAYFAHPTAYLLISRNRTRYEKGDWWPQLNGRPILFGDINPVGIISPFRLHAVRTR